MKVGRAQNAVELGKAHQKDKRDPASHIYGGGGGWVRGLGVGGGLGSVSGSNFGSRSGLGSSSERVPCASKKHTKPAQRPPFLGGVVCQNIHYSRADSGDPAS